MSKCTTCNGTGERMVGEQRVGGMMKPRYEECRTCDGTGEKGVEEELGECGHQRREQYVVERYGVTGATFTKLLYL